MSSNVGLAWDHEDPLNTWEPTVPAATQKLVEGAHDTAS
jgi:hypothetical protein